MIPNTGSTVSTAHLLLNRHHERISDAALLIRVPEELKGRIETPAAQAVKATVTAISLFVVCIFPWAQVSHGDDFVLLFDGVEQSIVADTVSIEVAVLTL